jgi:hypothetical protein
MTTAVPDLVQPDSSEGVLHAVPYLMRFGPSDQLSKWRASRPRFRYREVEIEFLEIRNGDMTGTTNFTSM